MIRVMSVQFQGGPQQPLMLQLGWDDPEKKMLRTEMGNMALAALKSFQESMKLIGGTFDLERMCEYLTKREALGANLAKVVVFDPSNGMGVEWTKPPKPLFVLPAGEVSPVAER